MVDVENRDVILKTFNTAKEFAEKILFPLMFNFKKFQRQANYGHEDLQKANEIPEEFRDIERFNGLKGMGETTHDLLYAITSTVRLKRNKEENEKLNEYLTIIKKVIDIFYEHRNRFFISTLKDMKPVEVLDRDYFNIMKDIINACYSNTEILMTKNKLLFDDSKDEFLNDDEIKRQIMDEYVDG